MKKSYWENLINNKVLLNANDEENLEEKKNLYFKVIRDISLTEDEFHYPELRQKYMQLVGQLEEVIKSINKGITLEKGKENMTSIVDSEYKKIHSDLERYTKESSKIFKEYEELIYSKWSKTWEENKQLV